MTISEKSQEKEQVKSSKIKRSSKKSCEEPLTQTYLQATTRRSESKTLKAAAVDSLPPSESNSYDFESIKDFLSVPNPLLLITSSEIPAPTGSASSLTPAGDSTALELAKSDGRAATLARGVARSTDRYDLAGIVPGVATRLVGNLAGLAGIGVGYAVSKVESAIWGTEVADSRSFQTACRTMLYANGILPTLVVEDTTSKALEASETVAKRQSKQLRRVCTVPRLMPLDEDGGRTEAVRQAPIIVCNHVSYLDAVVLPVVLQFPRFLSKTEVKKWPLFGAFGEDLDYIWVDRTSQDSRTAAATAIKEHAETWKPSQRPLVVFPEGTTSSGRNLLPFRPGAFSPGKPVLPVLVKYTGAWDPSNPDFREEDAMEWMNQQAGKRRSKPGAFVPYSESDWAAQFVGHLVHRCVVYVCPVYEPSQEERGNPLLFMENVQGMMGSRLNELHEALDGWDEYTDEDDAATRIKAWRAAKRRSSKR